MLQEELLLGKKFGKRIQLSDSALHQLFALADDRKNNRQDRQNAKKSCVPFFFPQAVEDLGGGNVSEPNREQARFIARLQAYAEGRQIDFSDVLLAQNYLTDFGKQVIQHCRNIPYGQTLTYGELAEKAGSPRAARAVGNIMASNRTTLVVPCHRVVGSSGSLGGYSAPKGVRMKLRLLEQEGCATLSGK